ncbi:MAG: crossover junction endodeoxyribonuclease RuvC [Lachnospiraceae bacterium]|nr:crossover junction endodeoxyribonuclease RuvC [Lachnospiraceae bacterium]
MGAVKMLALDTSTTKTGYAVYENGVLTQHGVVESGKKLGADERTLDMMRRIRNLYLETTPDIIVVEMVAMGQNHTTTRKLCEIVGAVCYQSVLDDLEYYEIRPAEWRKMVCGEGEKVCGNRETLKKWDIEKVRALYGLDVGDDEADAILIGLAYIKTFQD